MATNAILNIPHAFAPGAAFAHQLIKQVTLFVMHLKNAVQKVARA